MRMVYTAPQTSPTRNKEPRTVAAAHSRTATIQNLLRNTRTNPAAAQMPVAVITNPAWENMP